MQEAVIVSTARTALTKSFRGSFNDTEAPVLGGHVVRAVVERAGVAPDEVGDVIMGAAVQQGTQGFNIGRLCAYTGGLPDSVPGMALDRMCASGLMARPPKRLRNPTAPRSHLGRCAVSATMSPMPRPQRSVIGPGGGRIRLSRAATRPASSVWGWALR